MSMGWTFESFDPERWREWTGGGLSNEKKARLRNAVLWDHEGLTDDRSRQLGVATDQVATIGIEATYRESNEALLPVLDELLCSLFTPESLARELSVRGYVDPWNWKAIEALVTSGDGIE